jgi:hypothetical protein
MPASWRICSETRFPAMTDSNPPKAMPGVSLRVLNKVNGPIEGYEPVIVEIKVSAGTLVGRHSHPGIESTYIVEGSGELTGKLLACLNPAKRFRCPPTLSTGSRSATRMRHTSLSII